MGAEHADSGLPQQLLPVADLLLAGDTVHAPAIQADICAGWGVPANRESLIGVPIFYLTAQFVSGRTAQTAGFLAFNSIIEPETHVSPCLYPTAIGKHLLDSVQWMRDTPEAVLLLSCLSEAMSTRGSILHTGIPIQQILLSLNEENQAVGPDPAIR